MTLIALTFSAVLAVTTAERAIAEHLKARAADVKRVSGYVIMLLGVWMLGLAAFAERFATLFPV